MLAKYKTNLVNLWWGMKHRPKLIVTIQPEEIKFQKKTFFSFLFGKQESNSIYLILIPSQSTFISNIWIIKQEIYKLMSFVMQLNWNASNSNICNKYSL